MTILDSGAMTPRPASSLPTIQGERIDLRPVRRSDAGAITLHCSDRRVAWMTASIPHPYPPGAAEAWIESVTRPGTPASVWVIDGTRSGRPEVLGTIGIKPEDASVGYWIAPPAWGQGIATEALRALVAANPTGTPSFTACVFEDNPASMHVLRAAGFEEAAGGCEGYSLARGGRAPQRNFRLDL